VTVRDDWLQKTFGAADLQRAACALDGDALRIEKTFRGAPWILRERYACEAGALRWEAAVVLDAGEFRSCAIRWVLPWPRPVFPVSFWAARDGMPSAPSRHAGISLEYGEITSGILLPALSAYLESRKAGLLLAMPFDFRTPRLAFKSAFREPDLRAEFDWLALSPARSARASLLIRGTEGAWRPALGWLYERYKEYFEPRSRLAGRLWGGHVSGTCHVSPEEARAMADLGLKWHEIHEHFPHYGNYHPEGVTEWRSGHAREDATPISVDLIRKTIANLHAAGACAMPYIQVAGDVDEALAEKFYDSLIRDWHGGTWSVWPGTLMMNSDPSLAFGRDLERQVRGLVARYPEMDGVFLDQAGYNFLDTAHDDGITAVNNRPGYMTGFAYFPHVERLSALLHPEKAIIANGPFGIGLLKYVDAFMAEGSGWLCDHLQYYGLAKPMFFLMYASGDRDIELMFQRCLMYGAGFTSYAKAAPSRDLYARYIPLLERLYNRRWVFDADPIRLPTGFGGNLFRSPSGSLVAGLAATMPRLGGRSGGSAAVCVKTADVSQVRRVTLRDVEGGVQDLPFGRDSGSLQFDLPAGTQAAVAELAGVIACLPAGSAQDEDGGFLRAKPEADAEGLAAAGQQGVGLVALGHAPGGRGRPDGHDRAEACVFVRVGRDQDGFAALGFIGDQASRRDGGGRIGEPPENFRQGGADDRADAFAPVPKPDVPVVIDQRRRHVEKRGRSPPVLIEHQHGDLGLDQDGRVLGPVFPDAFGFIADFGHRAQEAAGGPEMDCAPVGAGVFHAKQVIEPRYVFEGDQVDALLVQRPDGVAIFF